MRRGHPSHATNGTRLPADDARRSTTTTTTTSPTRRTTSTGARRRCCTPTCRGCRRRSSSPPASIRCATKGWSTPNALVAAGNRATYVCFERQIHGFITMGKVHRRGEHGGDVVRRRAGARAAALSQRGSAPAAAREAPQRGADSPLAAALALWVLFFAASPVLRPASAAHGRSAARFRRAWPVARPACAAAWPVCAAGFGGAMADRAAGLGGAMADRAAGFGGRMADVRPVWRPRGRSRRPPGRPTRRRSPARPRPTGARRTGRARRATTSWTSGCDRVADYRVGKRGAVGFRAPGAATTSAECHGMTTSCGAAAPGRAR